MAIDIYKEEVLEHYQNPQNQGVLVEDGVLEQKDSNASCGDMIRFQVKVRGGVVSEVKWKGLGCAITTASASKLSEWVKGKEVGVLKKMSEEEILKEAIGWEVSPGRQKCLSLPVRVVKKLAFEV